MAAAAYPTGRLLRLRPLDGQLPALLAHLAAWHRGPGRTLPGTRLHILLEEADGAVTVLHLFESAATAERARMAPQQSEWEAGLRVLLADPPAVTEVRATWNAAQDARPKVSVSIDRDVHASVQDLIARLIDRHPRTPGESLYLSLLQSIADDYEQEFPSTMPEEGEPR